MNAAQTQRAALNYRRVQKITVAEWRPKIAALVAPLPEAQRETATQVGLVGVLVALETHVPGRPFEPLAWQCAADELRRKRPAGCVLTRATSKG